MKRGQGKAAARGFSGGGFGGGFGAFGGASSGSSLSYLAEPPSFHAIQDPHVVVSLKNILKKDSTTKSKALDELLAHVQAHPHDQDGGVDDAILDVWTQIYPRASIDNARRVREQSHSLQLELLKSARKRMERRIPKIVGAWLAGLYDRDRVVARAVSEGLSSFLNSPDKAAAFWKKCQEQILAFALEAIQETQESLSDERSTTKEDAEAKYFRVINASLSLAYNLLQRMDDAEMEKCRASYDEYFAGDSVWKSITLDDAAVRRSVCQLLALCLDRKLSYADSVECRQAMVTGGLKTTQTGSAYDYVNTLARLTQSYPDIWAASAKSKKSPVSRLQSFISKGSQGSRATYWESLDRLLSLLPREDPILQTESELLDSIKAGIECKDETRANAPAAWKCYTNAAQRALRSLSEADGATLAKSHLLPLFETYLFPTATRSLALPTLATLSDVYLTLLHSSNAVLSTTEEELTRIAGVFRTHLAGSLPAVSKDYQSSQEKIGDYGRRWFQLVKEVHAADSTPPKNLFAAPSLNIITQSISLLESRNMKPFGAARIIEQGLTLAPHIFTGDAATRIDTFLRAAAEDGMERIVESAAAPMLLSCVELTGSLPSLQEKYNAIWSSWTDATLNLPPSDQQTTTLAALVSQKQASDLVRAGAQLQHTVMSQAMSLAKGSGDNWSLLTAAVSNGALTEENQQTLVKDLVEVVDKQPDEKSLQALEVVARGMPQLLAQDDALHTALVAILLRLTEVNSSPAVSAKALSIRSLLDNHSEGVKLPVVGIIQSNLERASPQSLDIETLVKQATEAASGDASLEDLLPSTNVWLQELAPFFDRPTNPSLSITNIVGGAAILTKTATSGNNNVRLQRDKRGRSVPARMAVYCSLMAANNVDFSKLPIQFQVELLYLQCVTIQLVSDQITLLDSNGLWFSLADSDYVNEAETVVSSLRTLLNQYASVREWWVDTNTDSDAEMARRLVEFLLQESKSLSPRAVYSTRALAEFLQATAEAQGLSPTLEEKLVRSDVLKTTPDTALVAAALLAGFGESLQASKQVNNFCNRLASDIAGAAVDGERTKTILALTSLCSGPYEQGQLPIANNRIVFAVRQITSWLEDLDALDAQMSTQICRALAVLLPCMNEVYGSYWEKTVELCLHIWNHAATYEPEEALPLIHSSLKLSRCLQAISEPNDDLEDALKDLEAAKPQALLELLKLPRESTSQASEIVDAMISREVEKISVRSLPELTEIYPLVASESKEVQSAAYGLLHRAIPDRQQQASVDTLLDKTDARIPEELLSLMLDAPTLENYSDESLAQFPLSIRCYLLAWKLVFDAFSASSFKVRNDFTENLKTDEYVSPLLDFLFDVLGHSAAHPLNLDKERLGPEHIYDYDLRLADGEHDEKSMQWLLVHLYYLVLKYIPGLFRSWYIGCRSKQTRIAVESWTTKYYSPLIVTDSLDEVQKWSESQEMPAADEQELLVKVSKSAREVTAGYEVDDSQAAIVIKIPSSYPIEGVTVNGLRRVAVTERKWQSWIMTTQGVITFSNGNIIDGLQVFKRNIVGALKGQSECAICYSMISTDKRMPDKRCTTCKNLFHRTCLYKWFQSSNQNTCPLCRNPIDYLGADTQKRRQ